LYKRKASELVDLHGEYAKQLELERRQNDAVVDSTPHLPCTHLVPLIQTTYNVRDLEKEISDSENALMALYEKKRNFGVPETMSAHQRTPKYLGFFLLPEGKIKHVSLGLDEDTGDESFCQLMLAKHGYSQNHKGKRITHFTSN
jgi:hypothetical protein